MKQHRKINLYLGLVATLCMLCPSTRAVAAGSEKKQTAAPADVVADDTMLRAFKDELDRTMTRLKLDGHPLPYFTSYLGTEYDGFTINGSFGAIDTHTTNHMRMITMDVRVGDKKFDGSGGNQMDFGMMGSRGYFSLDDNYDAIRHELWLGTDSAYKRAIESLESKKATLQHKKIEDLPDSMSAVKPVVAIESKATMDADPTSWNQTVRDVSAVFKSFPAVIDSEVTFQSRAYTRWFASSEGSITREGEGGSNIIMSAVAQAPDGMNVSDADLIGAEFVKQLPSQADLENAARKLGERVTALAKAPVADEDYRGPILLEKQASAEFFLQTLGPNLVNPNENLFQGGHFSFFGGGGMKEKIGRRILPTTITVVDDPTAREFNGMPLIGGYKTDDEGVAAQKVVLVQNGILKTLCSTRTPSKYVKESNGHCERGSAAISQLFITTSEPIPMTTMKQKLLQMGKEDGLKYVLIARRIEDFSTRMMNHSLSLSTFIGSMGGGEQLSLSAPTILYKVNVEDGSEQLVRGAKFEHLTTRVWRDIVACGDDTQPYLVLSRGSYNSLVAPSILISEIDSTRASRETDKPMLLKNAYFDKAQAKASTKAPPN